MAIKPDDKLVPLHTYVALITKNTKGAAGIEFKSSEQEEVIMIRRKLGDGLFQGLVLNLNTKINICVMNL